MVTSFDISQEIFSIDVLRALKPNHAEKYVFADIQHLSLYTQLIVIFELKPGFH